MKRFVDHGTTVSEFFGGNHLKKEKTKEEKRKVHLNKLGKEVIL
jgi:hypothetical protein